MYRTISGCLRKTRDKRAAKPFVGEEPVGRPRILPLPDAQATVIMRGLEEMRPHFERIAPGQSKRALWEAVVEWVHQATGRIYSHQTYRAILKVYGQAWTGQAEAGGEGGVWQYGPSTSTLQAAIRAVKRRREADLTSSTLESLPQQAFVPVPRREPPTAQWAEVVEKPVDEGREMERFLRMEIEALRAELSMERSQRLDAVARQERAVEEARGLSDRLHALEAAYAEQQTIQAQLTAALERMQAQSDASHKYALLQIERVRGETRDKEKEIGVAQEQLSAARQLLDNERALAESYRRQVHALRHRGEPAQ